MEPTGNIELDKLLQDVKRTIKENRVFLENLKQEPLSEGSEVEELAADVINVEAFEEL
ncbi:MAG: hypothetical protein PHR66_03800 [Desulfuromonadaceae bacterium]|nr:hypothetical protein [Desulfuromonadaceae bacterium]